MSVSNDAKVFIVDDDLTLLEYMHDILNDCGIKARIYVRAGDALADAVKENPVVVMTDLSLPDINGKELAVRLVENDPKVRVFIMTGFCGETLEDNAELKGMGRQVEIIIKPFDIKALVNKMYDILGN